MVLSVGRTRAFKRGAAAEAVEVVPGYDNIRIRLQNCERLNFGLARLKESNEYPLDTVSSVETQMKRRLG